MGWTHWRKIANQHHWYSEELDWDGPACYQLSIAGPRGGGRIIVYVGETSNEMKRMAAYAQHGSHLSEIIAWHLKQGVHLYYRAKAAKSKNDAIKFQNSLLSKLDYDWNIQLNTWGK